MQPPRTSLDDEIGLGLDEECGGGEDRCRTDPQVQLLSHIHGVADVAVWLCERLAGPSDGVGGDLGKLCSEDLQVGLD